MTAVTTFDAASSSITGWQVANEHGVVVVVLNAISKNNQLALLAWTLVMGSTNRGAFKSATFKGFLGCVAEQ